MATTKKESKATVRIPLVGPPNTRAFWSSSTPGTSSGYVGVGIVGIMIVGEVLVSTQDQRFVNVIPDKVINPFTDKERFYINKRPGFETHTTPAGAVASQGIKIWIGQGSGDKVISAHGATNSTIYDGTSSLGATTGLVRNIHETIIGTTPNLVFSMTNGRGYYYPEGGALTEIVDADYPVATATGDFVFLDGYTFITTTDGKIYNSDLNSISAWTSTSFLSTNMSPDKGVSLAKYKDLVVAFGRESIEMFRNVGNAVGSPLQRVPEAFIFLGAVSAQAIAQVEENIVWAASSRIGNTSIYILDGYKPVRISTDAIDTQLAIVGSAIALSTIKMQGKTLIFVQFGDTTYVYCLEDKMWHEWDSGAEINYWYKWAANTAASNLLYSIADGATGKVYKTNVASPVFADDGTNFVAMIQTSKVDLDNENRKFLNRLTLVGDKSTATNAMGIQWSDNDYLTFSSSRSVDLGTDRRYLSNCGSFRRRAFKLSNSSNVPFRLEAMEFDVTQGLN